MARHGCRSTGLLSTVFPVPANKPPQTCSCTTHSSPHYRRPLRADWPGISQGRCLNLPRVMSIGHCGLYHLSGRARTQSLSGTDLSKRALVHQGEELTPAQSQELREMADQFADGFSSVPGRTHLVQHDIKTPLGVVVRQQPYCVPAAHCQAIEEEVHQMLQDRIIKESSPIVLVPKPDGSIWLCNDFWRLNWVSDFNAYPLPGPGGVTVERRFISTLDLTKGYWQVALNHYLRQPLAVPGSPLQAAWGASYVPVTHGHRLETPQALYSHVHRRCGNTFLHLVRPPLPPDGRVGTPEVWANHQPKKMSPGVNGGTVPEVPHRPRTTHVTREEDLGGA
ncbi:uncharacterized protein LOC113535654 isoform X2 [Pangasianodon hypophthalmus]|uniref:uncharacterized protein LOC113535654 isoform X2 n=1 Tax=Pangasianodon hypophthalmus TaxID=310915 RepID=UPI000EFFD849|nr:uncharacterized protein LOC113535654 isoform X2 [Pangasianodon hypophthalmus]